jgi:hypothetical protein
MEYTVKQKAWSLIWYGISGSPITVQREYRKKFGLHTQLPNHQNFRYWSDVNPGWYRELPLNSPRVSVWAAIGRMGVVGPVFFHNNVTAASYLELLENRFLPVVRTWPSFGDLVFMQDGAPPHHHAAVHEWLNRHFTNRWIGRSSANLIAPFRWPPYSPDLTPCDFFLWGWVKSQIYRTQPTDLDDLQSRIQQAFDELPQEMINRAIDSYERRLERCIEVDGKSVEINYGI